MSDGFARRGRLRWLVCAAVVLSWGQFGIAADLTLENVQDPGPNRLDEAKRAFSLEKAAEFLDAASLTWQKQRKCFTCHTNYAYLYARPAISHQNAAHQTVRKFAEELVSKRWKSVGPRWDAEVVATAAALAFNDRVTTGELHPLTRTALDRMWKIQRADGGWDWLNCDWPPMESDDHYGATLAAIAVGVAPGEYRQTPAAQEGMAKLRKYLAANPAQHLHQRAMLLWADSYFGDLLKADERTAIVEELVAKQREDGGWAAATLGLWKRADGTPQQTEVSDGYGTGFTLYVLRQGGVPADDLRIQRGIAWLKANQRESGRWISRSLHRDNKHFLSHAGTAFAVMALDAVK